MLAVDAELTTGGLGGPLMIESLANILAVRLLRYIFGLRRLVTRSDGVLTRRKLTTIVDYIMANLHRSPTLEEMAASVNDVDGDSPWREVDGQTSCQNRHCRLRHRINTTAGKSGSICGDASDHNNSTAFLHMP